MKILQKTYNPIVQKGPDDVHGHGYTVLYVNLPPATTVGDRVGVREDPTISQYLMTQVIVIPDGTDTINGAAYFQLTDYLQTKGSSFTFVVGEVGNWWIESAYVPPTL